jgi:hypothetical protein
MFISISPNLIVDVLLNAGIFILIAIPIILFLWWNFSSNDKKAKKRAKEWLADGRVPENKRNFELVMKLLNKDDDDEAIDLYHKLQELKESKAT